MQSAGRAINPSSHAANAQIAEEHAILKAQTHGYQGEVAKVDAALVERIADRRHCNGNRRQQAKSLEGEVRQTPHFRSTIRVHQIASQTTTGKQTNNRKAIGTGSSDPGGQARRDATSKIGARQN